MTSSTASRFASFLYEVTRTYETELRYADVMDIFKLLKETGSVIAGSSVLAFMRNEAGFSTFTPNDIDIFTNEITFMDLMKQKLDVTWRSMGEIHYDGHMSAMKVYTVSMKYNGLDNDSFQVIVVQKPVMDVINDFDIDICSKSFNGESFYSKIPIERNLFNTTLNMENCSKARMLKTVFRCVKYTERGFGIENIYTVGTPETSMVSYVEDYSNDKNAYSDIYKRLLNALRRNWRG